MAAVGVEDRLARDDADLVAEIAAGDIGEPVNELYRRYGPKLHRFGLHLLGDAGLADELVQECFVRLWRTAGRFDIARGTVAAYLFVMARSIAADLRKRPSSRPLAPVDEEQAPVQPDNAGHRRLTMRDPLLSMSVKMAGRADPGRGCIRP